MLRLVVEEKEITRCQKQFKSVLKSELPKKKKTIIGHQGGNFEDEIHHNNDLWYSEMLLTEDKVSIARYWNGFGLGVRESGNQIIIVEINFVLSGDTKQVAGLFAKDEAGKYYILHRGKVGGGRKGIGKDSFKNWYRGKWVDVYDELGNAEETILIGSLNEKSLIGKVRAFVKEVELFKEEAISGKSSRAPKKIKKTLLFDPEFHGRKKGRRKSEFEYESYHGLVVNSLNEQFEHKSSTFNDRLIDLAVQKKGKIQKIYEVKTSLNRQAIYTGIGQLMFHSSGDDNIEKILVLPADDYPKEFTEILGVLNISILPYKILNGEKVQFGETLK